MRRISTSNKTPDEPGDIRFPRMCARLSASALRTSFYAIVHQLAGGRGVLPMVKADAYGHGAQWAVRELLGLGSRQLEGFGVASLEEGAALREGAAGRHPRMRVLCFSGATIWSEEKRRFCLRHGLTPVLASVDDFRRFARRGGGIGELPYELKFDTGMHRLGIGLADAPEIARALARRPRPEQPSGVMSHLAISEDPGAPLTRRQIVRFRELRALFTRACPGARFHLANSGAIWNERALGLRELTDFARPGISLYGVPPWPGAPARGLRPVMRVSARVIATKHVPAGESIGYGATFRAPRPRGLEIAILSGGYADGVKRQLSNSGSVRLGTRTLPVTVPILGIVSMDLTAVGAPGVRPRRGEWADLIGPGLDIWAQARAAGTIPYELLTSWSSRVERIYE